MGGVYKAQAQNPTPNNWKCVESVGGEWHFGRAPNACRVSTFQNEADVRQYWPQVTFRDSNSRTSERNRYMAEMNELLTGMGVAYLKKRKPSASSAEQAAWTKALLALAHQESFWSHYRTGTDNKLRMMRGDFGHGHGLMQVDDRWHFVHVKEGGAARIQDNIIYALDLIYKEWQRAASASCVGGASNYVARTRAMYSAYNGGPSKLCRWTNPNDTWARNDKNYWDKFSSQSWVRYIDNRTTYAYNFNCLVQGGGLQCFDQEAEEPTSPADPTDPNDEDLSVLSKLQIYTVSEDYHCTWNDKFLSCLPYSMGQSAVQCLKDLWGLDAATQPVDLASVTSVNVETKMINPSTKCRSQALVQIGDYVEAVVNINLRKTPGGDKISVIAKNKTYQVLDNYVNSVSGIRYYLVTDGKDTGYVHGGTNEDYYTYLVPSSKQSAVRYVANLGDRIMVTGPYGINLRATAAGTLILNIPNGERLNVKGRIIRNDDRDVYYKVEYKGHTGYIYSGRLAPSPTTQDWTEVE